MGSAAAVGITADKIIHTKVEVARVYFRWIIVGGNYLDTKNVLVISNADSGWRL